jgi:hypothetical protein
MLELKHDTRTLLRQLRRALARDDLRFAKFLDHWGIPDVSEEEVDKALAKEGLTRPVKSTTAAAGHLSTSGPSIHRRPRAALPTRNGEPR